MNWQDNKPDFERLMKLYGSDVYRMSVLRLLKVTVNECINIHKSARKRHATSASDSIDE